MLIILVLSTINHFNVYILYIVRWIFRPLLERKCPLYFGRKLVLVRLLTNFYTWLYDLFWPLLEEKLPDLMYFIRKKLVLLRLLTNLFFRTHLKKKSRLNADSGFPIHSDSESQVRLNWIDKVHAVLISPLAESEKWERKYKDRMLRNLKKL